MDPLQMLIASALDQQQNDQEQPPIAPNDEARQRARPGFNAQSPLHSPGFKMLMDRFDRGKSAPICTPEYQGS